MSPNDFGIYAGTIYASYWTPEIGFDGSSKPIPPLIIYDLSGRKVAILVNERKVPGIHEIMWNAERMEPGVYMCTFHSEARFKAIKMILVN